MAVIQSELNFTPAEINGLVSFQKCTTDFIITLGYWSCVCSYSSVTA